MRITNTPISPTYFLNEIHGHFSKLNSNWPENIRKDYSDICKLLGEFVYKHQDYFEFRIGK